ncbi:MAG: type II toxin-antitoxin system Phd/YefM family antitoxin [Thermoleophilaceae bacterium]|nr:type II toxin-antitoxin system Phd/YefM family antitoxin [Thermoleophilaceae bacterium]
MSDEVGIRELRQDLSRYLRRVREGERLVVTDRNRPVALLTPLPEDEDPWQRLIAEGKVVPATHRLEDLPPPLEVDGGPTVSETLEEMRRESREAEAGR